MVWSGITEVPHLHLVRGLHSNGLNTQQVMPSDDGEMLPNGSVSLKSDSVEEQQGEKSKTVEQEAPKGEKGEESSTPESQAVKLLKNGGKSRVSSKAGAGGSVIGAYVHVTKINEAGKKTENLRKLFPRGKEVCLGMRYFS